MGVYFDSDGNAYGQTTINNKIRKAKEQVIEIFWDEHNREPFCQDCFRNDCVPVDMSHNVSIQEAKNMRRVELCWDVNNIVPRGRKCHQKKDGLGLIWR